MVHVSDPCARVQVLASFDHIVLELHGVRAKPPPTPLSPLSPPQRAAAHHRALVGGQVSELLPMRRRAATLAKLNLFFVVVHVHVNNHGLDRRAGLARKFERVLGCVHWWEERAIDRAHPRGQPAALPPHPAGPILFQVRRAHDARGEPREQKARARPLARRPRVAAAAHRRARPPQRKGAGRVVERVAVGVRRRGVVSGLRCAS